MIESGRYPIGLFLGFDLFDRYKYFAMKENRFLDHSDDSSDNRTRHAFNRLEKDEHFDSFFHSR